MRNLTTHLIQEESAPAERLARTFREAYRLSGAFSLETFLVRLLGAAGGEILRHTYGWFHLGFLTPPGLSAEVIGDIGRRCGFGHHQAFFRSEVMALELASLSGGRPVPTTIFKGFSGVRRGTTAGVETFTPGAEENVVREWLSRGVGTHIGIGLSNREWVYEALESCRLTGFRPPEFLGGRPALNSSEEILVGYTDGPLDGVPIRIEFYHSPSEISRAR